jgi:hypothetical protein
MCEALDLILRTNDREREKGKERVGEKRDTGTLIS